MGDALEKVVERWAGRRSFLGNLARGAVGLTIALAGFRGFEGKVHASGCDLCDGSTSGCSDNCVEDGEICSWGWNDPEDPNCVCFECFHCICFSIDICYPGCIECSERLCF